MNVRTTIMKTQINKTKLINYITDKNTRNKNGWKTDRSADWSDLVGPVTTLMISIKTIKLRQT